MGAMKNLVIDIADTMYQISRDLNEASESGDFDKMKQSQQTKISRVAADLAALHQGFLGFMAQTKNPKYKYV